MWGFHVIAENNSTMSKSEYQRQYIQYDVPSLLVILNFENNI